MKKMADNKRHFLIDLRKENGWAQGYIAKQLGISQQAVSFHESGGHIKPETAFKYIDFYKCRTNTELALTDFYR